MPESLTSDNGPQYAADQFKSFAKEYGFTHLTSSPRYPQGNGFAERIVRTVKNLLEKGDDPYIALMAYRFTPLENGYSPSELLMGRKLRTTIPMITEQLLPSIPPMFLVKGKEVMIRERQHKNFNKYHRASPLKLLKSGDLVYIPDNERQGTIIEESSTRSYTVQTPEGTYRRYRRQLVPLPTTENNTEAEANDHPDILPDGVSRTKSGRISKPPNRLNL